MTQLLTLVINEDELLADIQKYNYEMLPKSYTHLNNLIKYDELWLNTAENKL